MNAFRKSFKLRGGMWAQGMIEIMQRLYRKYHLYKEANYLLAEINYAAFYVKEPFKETNLGANLAHDFVYYNTLRMWKGADSSFPFYDAHGTTYQVRDGSLWSTLKYRLRERLDNSKNIINYEEVFDGRYRSRSYLRCIYQLLEKQ